MSDHRRRLIESYAFPLIDRTEFNYAVGRMRKVAAELDQYGETGQFRSCLTYNNFVTAANCFGVPLTDQGVRRHLGSDRGIQAYETFLYALGLDGDNADPIFLKLFLEDIQCR